MLLAASPLSWHPRPVSKLQLLLERGLPVAILAVAGIGAPAMMLAPDGLPRLRSLESELHQVREENAAINEKIQQLQRQIQKLKEDPKAVERIARDELGLVRNTEVVFQFPPQP
jgi:cell division protein FtsB